MAPLDHLFNNHHICDATWWHTNKALDNDVQPDVDCKEEISYKIYYRSMVEDTILYKTMKEKYAKYIYEEYLRHF